jgi:hypothetical protein
VVSSRLLTAAGFLAAALGYTLYGLTYEFGSIATPGQGFMPRFLGVGWSILAALSFFREYGSLRSSPREETDQGSLSRPLALCGLVLFYVIFSNWLGHLLTFALTLWFAAWVSGVHSRLRRLVLVVLVVGSAYVVFQIWLGLPLPKGLLPW